MFNLWKKEKKSNLVDMTGTAGVVAVRNASHPKREVALATLWVWGDKRISQKPVLADRLSFSQLLSQKDAEAVVFG